MSHYYTYFRNYVWIIRKHIKYLKILDRDFKFLKQSKFAKVIQEEKENIICNRFRNVSGRFQSFHKENTRLR